MRKESVQVGENKSDGSIDFKILSIIEGRAKIIDWRKRSCIHGDQGNFKDAVRSYVGVLIVLKLIFLRKRRRLSCYPVKHFASDELLRKVLFQKGANSPKIPPEPCRNNEHFNTCSGQFNPPDSLNSPAKKPWQCKN